MSVPLPFAPIHLDPSQPVPPDVLTALEHQVEYALFFVLEKQDTQDYMEAREIIPEIFKQESKMADFLKFEDYNPLRAATRLAKYWKTRKFIFAERWLLPMVQTGWGALTPEQVEILRTGYSMLLRSSKMGYVSVFDYSKLPDKLPKVQWQTVFYIVSLMSGSSSTVLLVVKRGYQGPRVFFEPEMFEMVRESFPFTVDQFVVAQAYEFGFENLLEFMAQQERTFLQGNAPDFPAYVITGDSAKSTLQKLLDRGFDRDCLPQCLGGNVQERDTVQKWIRGRLSVEECIGDAFVSRSNNLRPPMSMVAKSSGGNGSDAMMMMLHRLRFLTGAARQETQRQYINHKSRCARERKKLDLMIMQGKVIMLRKHQEWLKSENERLQGLLTQARAVLLTRQYTIQPMERELDEKLSRHP